MIYILIHFLLSLLELTFLFSILSLQITLAVTGTCSFRIGAGFWSFPISFLSPLSLWLLIYQQNAIACCFALVSHFCSTLVLTAVIIISFLTLIDQVGSSCIRSNDHFFSINLSLIVISFGFKLLVYVEICLLYSLQRSQDHSIILSEEQFRGKNYQILTEEQISSIFKSMGDELKTNTNRSDC